MTAGGLVPSQTYKDLAARADNTAGMSHGVGRQNICKDHSRSSGNGLFSSSQNPKDNKAHVIPGSILYYHV